MGSPVNPAGGQASNSLFKRATSASATSRAEEAVQRFEGMLWNEVAQAMSAVRLGPSNLGSAGQTYERMMWRRIAMQDFNGTDHRLTAAIMRQLGVELPAPAPAHSATTAGGNGYTGLPTQDGVIDRNSAAMPSFVAALALSAPSATTAKATPPTSVNSSSVAALTQSMPSTTPTSVTPTSSTNTTNDPLSWVQDIWSAIKEGARALGVPVKALLAQAALETGWGSSAPGHNLFGVKAHGNSEAITALTHEFTDGVYRQEQATFASYPSVTHAVADFVKVLQSAHPSAVGQPTVAGYANALQASGYATDPRYAAKIEAVARSPRMQDLLRSVEE